jgi:hypothetical protein
VHAEARSANDFRGIVLSFRAGHKSDLRDIAANGTSINYAANPQGTGEIERHGEHLLSMCTPV